MISNIAKFYGFKPINTGTKKQRDYAERIREELLKSKKISEDEKVKLASITCGFINSYKFWIKNKNVNQSLFTYTNITAPYNEIERLKENHHELLARTGRAVDKDRARFEINNRKAKALFDYD